MQRIAVLTSGGDAPGMNAAVRSVVRLGISAGCEVMGIRDGYAGLMQGDVWPMGSRDVSEIIQRGGTILGSSRAPEFATPEGQREAISRLRGLDVEGLVVIGGNGSQAGASALSKLGFPVVGVASTIDNDLPGFDMTIGVDSALNITLEAIDRLKTTATSHQRAFIVEVMGRDHGFLALVAGMTGGAEAIVIPEHEISREVVAEKIRHAYELGKHHAIIVVAEGAEHNGEELEEYFGKYLPSGFELRLTKLGHVVRGGTPGVADRMLGLRTGYEATRRLLAGEHGIVVGSINGNIGALPLDEVVGKTKLLDTSLLEIAEVLAI